MTTIESLNREINAERWVRDHPKLFHVPANSPNLGCGGLPVKQKSLPLEEHKNNHNPPRKGAPGDPSLLRESREYFMDPPDSFYASLHMSDLRRWTLSEVQNHVNTHQPEWLNKAGERWTAPDCTIGILRYNDTGKFAGFIPCDSWRCPVCAVKKKMKLIKKVNHAFGDEKCFFMTLTTDSERFNDKHLMSDWTDDEGKTHMSAWGRLRSSLRRYGYFLPKKGHNFFWVKEFTDPAHAYTDTYGRLRMSHGYARHIHVIINFRIPTVLAEGVTIGTLWRKATDGVSSATHGVKITRETDTHGAVRASYMTKYITKSCSGETPEHDFGRYERRYGKSVGLFAMKPPSRHICFLQLLSHDDGVSFRRIMADLPTQTGYRPVGTNTAKVPLMSPL